MSRLMRDLSPETYVLRPDTPVGLSGSPLNRGISAGTGRIGVAARVDVASVLSIPVQQRDAGRHDIIAGDRVDPDRHRRHRPNHESSLARAGRSVLSQPDRSVEWTLRRRVEAGLVVRLCSSTHAEARPERTAHARTTGTRPERASRRSRPRCLLAHRSGSAGHVRELSFSDTVPAPQADRLWARLADAPAVVSYRDRAGVLLDVESASDEVESAAASLVSVGSSMKRSSPASARSKVSRAWEGSPRCPAVVAPSRSIT